MQSKRTPEERETARTAYEAGRVELLAQLQTQRKPSKVRTDLEIYQQKKAAAWTRLERIRSKIQTLKKQEQTLVNIIDPVIFPDENSNDSDITHVSATTVDDSDASNSQQLEDSQNLDTGSSQEIHFKGIRTRDYQFVTMWFRMSFLEKMSWFKPDDKYERYIIQKYDPEFLFARTWLNLSEDTKLIEYKTCTENEKCLIATYDKAFVETHVKAAR